MVSPECGSRIRTSVSTTSGGVKNSPASCVISELLDEVFIGSAQHIGWHAGVGQVVRVEVLNQRMDDFIGNQLLAATVRCRLRPLHREYAAQLFVGVRYRAHSCSERLA